MAHAAYIREKARELRREKDLSIDEIADRLAISRQTIFYWLRDLPLQRERRWTPAQRSRNNSNSAHYKRLRDEAYEEGAAMFDELCEEPSFRDFVCMYIGEGYKRSRNDVAVCNSDPNVVILCHHWIRRFSRNRVGFALQYHADQDPADLTRFWSRLLRISPNEIGLQRKSNSRQLKGRQWRSRHGVLAVRTGDTYLRAKLQAWMDRIAEEWLDSTGSGRGAAW